MPTDPVRHFSNNASPLVHAGLGLTSIENHRLRGLFPQDRIRALQGEFDEQMYQILGEERFSKQQDPDNERLKDFLISEFFNLQERLSILEDLQSKSEIDLSKIEAIDTYMGPKLQQAIGVLSYHGKSVDDVRALFVSSSAAEQQRLKEEAQTKLGLKLAINSLASQYEALSKLEYQRPDEQASVEDLRNLIADLSVKLDSIRSVNNDMDEFFRAKQTEGLGENFAYKNVFDALKARYTQAGIDYVNSDMPNKEEFIRSESEKLLAIDNKEYVYLNRPRTDWSQVDVKKEAECIYVFTLLKDAKQTGLFVGIEGGVDRLASLEILLSNPGGNPQFRTMTLLEYFTSSDDLTGVNIQYPQGLTPNDTVFLSRIPDQVTGFRVSLDKEIQVQNNEPVGRFEEFDSHIQNLDEYLNDYMVMFNIKHNTSLSLLTPFIYIKTIKTGGTFGKRRIQHIEISLKELLLGKYRDAESEDSFSYGGTQITIGPLRYYGYEALSSNKEKVIIDELSRANIQKDYLSIIDNELNSDQASRNNPESLVSKFNHHINNAFDALNLSDSDNVYELYTTEHPKYNWGSLVANAYHLNGGRKANGLVLVQLNSQVQDQMAPLVLLAPITGESVRFRTFEDFACVVQSDNELTAWIYAHLAPEDSREAGIKLRVVQKENLAKNIVHEMRLRIKESTDNAITSPSEANWRRAIKAVNELSLGIALPLVLLSPEVAIPLGIMLAAGPSFAKAIAADPADRERFIKEGLERMGISAGMIAGGSAIDAASSEFRSFVNTVRRKNGAVPTFKYESQTNSITYLSYGVKPGGSGVFPRGYTDNFRNAGEDAILLHGGKTERKLLMGEVAKLDSSGKYVINDKNTFSVTGPELAQVLRGMEPPINLYHQGGQPFRPVHLLSCYAKRGTAQDLADEINRPVIAYSTYQTHTESLLHMEDPSFEVGSGYHPLDPRRLVSDSHTANPRTFNPSSWPTKPRNLAELEKRITTQSLSHGEHYNVCYNAAISVAEQSGELSNKAVTNLRAIASRPRSYNNSYYASVFELNTSSPMSNLAVDDIQESGFFHFGGEGGEGKRLWRHVAYAHVGEDVGGQKIVTIYQANGGGYQVAMGFKAIDPKIHIATAKGPWNQNVVDELKALTNYANPYYKFTPANRVNGLADNFIL